MPQDFDLNRFKATYFEECQDLLASAEEYLGVLRAELGDVDVENLHAIFRCVHSIKGGAGAFNFTDLVDFSHVFETTLDKLREGEIAITEKLADCLIRANDILVLLVQLAQAEEPVDASIWKGVASELEGFSKGEADIVAPAPAFDYDLSEEEEEEQGWGLFLDNIDPETLAKTAQQVDPSKTENVIIEPKPVDGVKPAVTKPQTKTAPARKPRAKKKSSEPQGALYRILFVPEPHLLQFANEPLLLARELNTLGNCQSMADLSRLPALKDISADVAYLSWIFELQTERSIQDIEEVFEFVVDDCLLEITRIEASEFETADTEEEQEAIEDSEDSSEVEQAQNPVSTANENDDVKTQVDAPDEQVPSVTAGMPVPKEKESKIVTKTKVASDTIATPAVSSIRVDLDRVDRLVNMVGELVITQAMLKQQADELANNAGQVMAQGFEELSAHTRELQESVMAIRMQPVKSVFSRMPRLVRELSAKLDKNINLITSGEMTEVDKTVIEQLMDPLTHMIRNSVDHGIESSAERRAQGKPEKATIHLNAEHKSGRIQIEVFDDGRGIDRDRVFAKAVEKGLIDANADLDAEDIDNLIFAPGFTTAESVSDVSGRGVGMDVVRRNIVSLGGRISVYSTPGEGTRFTMSLPLTLAVLDGMIVKCGKEKYIIPLTSIIESIHPMEEELKTLVNGGALVSVRGEYIRIVNLYRLFNLPGAITNPAEALVVIVETDRFGYVGVMVDELLGQQQVVIKSLEENYDPIPGVAAATIMGNGKVALILDVDGLAEMEHGADKRRKTVGVTQQVLLTGE